MFIVRKVKYIGARNKSRVWLTENCKSLPFQGMYRRVLWIFAYKIFSDFVECDECHATCDGHTPGDQGHRCAEQESVEA